MVRPTVIDGQYARFTCPQSVIKASTKKNKKDKKKDKRAASTSDNENGDAARSEDEVSAVPKQAAIQVTAEELADEEWGPVKDKKGKKGKGKKGKAVQEDEEVPGMLCDFALPAPHT